MNKCANDKKNRGHRPHKRKFIGNQHVSSRSNSFASSQINKSSFFNNDKVSYEIINFTAVVEALILFIVCKECGESIKIKKCFAQGLGFQIKIECEKCEDILINSCSAAINKKKKIYDINSRFIFVMRYLGVGYTGLQTFCGLMDLPVPLVRRSYDKIIKIITNATKIICQFSFKKAVCDELLNYTNRESLIVSGDGSWRKRGFQSLHGVASLIGNFTGKIIDINVKSSYCAGCKLWESEIGTEKYVEWLENHETECQKNHEGAAGKMEVDAVIEMFSRSEETYEVKYKYYIGDGDTKTFKEILDKKPYGKMFEVHKKECIGHVQKRMGTRLRNAIKLNSNISGKGKLTNKLITDLSKYYGMAIRNNSTNIENMRKAIMATLYHKSSTDENPQHQFCPKGKNTWCKWQKAKFDNNLNNNKHKEPIPSDVKEILLPIYKDLSKKELLTRCIGAYTQNSNESLNNMIWKIASKRTFSGQEIVEIASYTAAAVFNDGCQALLAILNELNIKIGIRAKMACALINEKRLSDGNKCVEKRTKSSRIKKRIKQQEESNADKDVESSFYSCGAN